MSCDDVLKLSDLETAKKHDNFHTEVITGKSLTTGANIDHATNTVTGQVQKTLPKAINELGGMGYARVGTFATGATLTTARQTLLWDIADGGDGQEYGWSGAFPKVVPANSTPASAGGIGDGKWLSRFDPELRNELDQLNDTLFGQDGANSINASIGSIPISVNTKLYEIISVKDFGAAGDGVSDDTAAITAAISSAESRVIDRFGAGARVHFPAGEYLVSAQLVISSDRIALTGDSPACSVIKRTGGDGNIVSFDGSGVALYGCEISGLRLVNVGNATSGAQLHASKMIDFVISNVQFVGYYKGLNLGGCARTLITRVIFTQDTRTQGTSPSYAIDFTTAAGHCSDVHVSCYQIFMPDDRVSSYAISIRGADGIYFNNGHQQGGVLVQPEGLADIPCASVFFSQVYFDKATAENFIFTGSSFAYRQFEFSSCYFRGAVLGMVVNTTSVIDDVKIIGGDFADHTKSGIDFKNSNSSNFKIVGSGFRSNCSSNTSGDSDIILRGVGHIVSATTHSGGTDNCRGVNITSSATNASVSCDVTNSTMGLRVLNSSTTSKIGVVTGATFKARGSATIVAGSTTISVPHGMSMPPPLDSIHVTLRTGLYGATHYWISNAFTNTFDINLSSAPTSNVVLSWSADVTN